MLFANVSAVLEAGGCAAALEGMAGTLSSPLARHCASLCGLLRKSSLKGCPMLLFLTAVISIMGFVALTEAEGPLVGRPRQVD
jgi:hypothetical protein